MKNHPAEQAFNDFLSRFTVTGDKQEFCGLYGYTSFNAVRYFEHIEIKDCMQEKNDAPDILYILYKYVIAFDHFNNTMTLIELVENHEPDTLDELERVIRNHNFATYDFRPVGETFSTLTDDEHKANIRQGIAHCLRGDVFQIVLSRRFVQRYEGDDFKLYRALRSINPSPYLFYFDFGGFRIFGSSPETHCRIEGRHAYIDPIAGTTKRTGNAGYGCTICKLPEKRPERKRRTRHVGRPGAERPEPELPRRESGLLQRHAILQPCHPFGEPCKRYAG